ncbi:hypothetical protein [Cellulosimicrobium sp. CUA-896]|nr:hypothetical protein [Cellulosimicrobium sp. CUA-896]
MKTSTAAGATPAARMRSIDWVRPVLLDGLLMCPMLEAAPTAGPGDG